MEQSVAECYRQKVPEALDSNAHADITVTAERKPPNGGLRRPNERKPPAGAGLRTPKDVEATTGVA